MWMHLRRTMKRIILLALAAAALPAAADEFALRDGDTVAFLGDSITAARNYSKVIETYTLLRLPHPLRQAP